MGYQRIGHSASLLYLSVLLPALHHLDYCGILLKSGSVSLTTWFLFSVVLDIVDSFLLYTNCRISLSGSTKFWHLDWDCIESVDWPRKN